MSYPENIMNRVRALLQLDERVFFCERAPHLVFSVSKTTAIDSELPYFFPPVFDGTVWGVIHSDKFADLAPTTLITSDYTLDDFLEFDRDSQLAWKKIYIYIPDPDPPPPVEVIS